MKIKLDPLDKIYSEFIRCRAIKLVHGCERCLTWKEKYTDLQTAHFYGRSKKNLRYDIDNGVGLCGACHMYFHSHPNEFTEWFKAHLGEGAFDLLNARTRVTEKVDKELVTLFLRQLIKELENE